MNCVYHVLGCRFLMLIFICLLWNGAVPTAVADERDDKIALSKAKKILVRAIRGDNHDTAVEQIELIGRLESMECHNYLLSLITVQSEQLFEVVCEALAGDKGAERQQVLAELYAQSAKPRGGDWRAQVVLIDILAGLEGVESQQVMEKAVVDQHPKVRLAALRALAALEQPGPTTIPLTIRSLGASELAKDFGIPHFEARESLHQRTGQDLKDYQAWNELLEENGPIVQPPAKDESATSIENYDPVEYYSDVVVSRRIVFILDISGSMGAMLTGLETWPDAPKVPMTFERSGGQGGDQLGGVCTSDVWNQWFREHPESTRIGRAKLELTNIVSAMPAYACFNVISYNHQVHPWRKELIPIDARSRAAANRGISSLKESGATASDLALATAFDGNDLADTIYFLSDGEPSRDGRQVLPTDAILESVRYANRFKRITIHTLNFGGQGEDFLKKLAEENGGEYRYVDGTPAKKP